MKVTYRYRTMIDRFSCIDKTLTFYACDYFKPEGSSLYYFRVNSFNYKTVAEKDLVSIEKSN